MLLKPAKDAIDIGVIVSDIDKSLAFYQDLLGLPKTQELPTPLGTIHRLGYGQTDLKLVVPKRAPGAGELGLDRQLGYRYITFRIENLNEVCQRLESEGVEFTIPAQEILPGVHIAMVKDPDGNIVEFVQR